MGRLTFHIAIFVFTLGSIAGVCADRCGLGPIAEPPSPALSSTLGIEIEGTWPRKKSLKEMRDTVGDFLATQPGVADVQFSTSYPKGSTFRRLKMRYFHLLGFDTRDYTVSFKVGAEDYRFVFGSDFSIRPPRGRRGVELRSPILRTERDKELFEDLVGHLAAAGFEESPLSSGLHVHVGMGDASPHEIAGVVEDFARVENDVLEFFKVYEKRRGYTQPITDALKKLAQRPDENVTVPALQAASRDRYRMLNLMSLNRFGTAEFRFGNSTVDRETISFMAEFCLRFVEASRTRRAELDAILARGEASENFPALLEFLNLPANARQQAIGRKLLADIESAQTKDYSSLSPGNNLVIRALVPPAIGIAVLSVALARLLQSDDKTPKEETPKDEKKNDGLGFSHSRYE